MENQPAAPVTYKRARFTTHLPTDRLYSTSHFWMAQEEGDVWRVGFTKFATRMLGDLVEFGFSAQAGETVEVGQQIGWVEGFKALSDLYSVVAGKFIGANSSLDQDITLTDTDPYGEGWLYKVRGKPQPNALDVNGYIQLLDQVIDRSKQAHEPDCNES